MNKTRIIAAIILFPLLLSLTAQGAGRQSRKKRRAPVKKMETVSIGRWGGGRVGMQVTADGAELDFDCAHAVINQPLNLDSGGNFDVQGRYMKEHGGPVRSDENQDGQAARFKGHFAGKTLTLTITLDDSDESLGPYTLEEGKYPRIVKCM
jgi:hypothetical protein